MNRSTKTAVILTNLGGPDSLEAVKPFLFNLFYDPAIISVSNPMRWFLAKFISSRREKEAQKIYGHIGGSSPILENTKAQMEAVESLIKEDAEIKNEVKCFIHMRYWHPMADEVAKDIKEWGADEVILLPLYPQYSTTTTFSSRKAVKESLAKLGLGDLPYKSICCYPREHGFIKAMVKLIEPAYEEAKKFGKGGKPPRILFSAHGLPKKIIDGGDPYQFQCEETIKAILSMLNINDLDWVGCYQSRVGPLEWITPATDDEIIRAGADGVPIIIVPIAFTSEHSETLVELGIEYKELAEEHDLPFYGVVETVSISDDYMKTLVDLIKKIQHSQKEIISAEGGRICPKTCHKCSMEKPD